MTLSDELSACEAKDPFGQQSFVPSSYLKTKINKQSISSQLPIRVRVLKPRLAEKVSRDANKVFAILVLIDEARAIHSMIQEGLKDEHLPLAYSTDRRKGVLVSRDGTEFKCFTSLNSRIRVQNFLKSQWMVQAPVFEPSGRHVDLHPDCAIPLTECKSVAKGPFAVVYKGLVHADHHRGFRDDGSTLEVALKEFRTEEAFEKERENLQQIQVLDHRHLIKVIATFSRDRFYYALFPWAEGGNLGDFWKRASSERTRKLALWSLCQMLGLAEALYALHEKNCRHGDLKPENVLHFKSGRDDDGILVIADMGVSKFHQQATNLRNEPTNTRATTPIYEAPEAQPDVKDPRSRRYDMWSMGCMFLEHMVWLLYGVEAMLRFRNSRKSVDPEIRDGSFYKRILKGSNSSSSKSRDALPEGGEADSPPADPSDLLHPKVLVALETLREDASCQPGTALGDLLRLISEDLMVDVNRRVGAAELVGKLRKMAGEASSGRGREYLRVRFDAGEETRRFLAVCSDA